MRNKADLIPTPSQTVGPYFHLGLTDKRSTACIAGEDVKGERVTIICSVFDGDGLAVPDAMIELWQADSEGRYNHPEDTWDETQRLTFQGFGRLPTREDGTCVFQTIKPGQVPGPKGQLQAPHINVSVFARGLLKHLPTRIYFEGDRANESDPVLALVPHERRLTLMATSDPANPGTWRFDVRLHGERETVFFDI
ncbi:MAG: protocatechuate 3,4-dioxygenase, alpha subunit [Acidobacteriaceae bacterium]|jgi:protocatechuate 3,4-dioxygenase alpha subunit|nr:protocatechuate 3,4-dioxygenase, alpha subunit [Acidobacteriaceae bacterium]